MVPKTLRPRAHNAAAVVNELKVDDMWQGYQTRQFSHETEDFGAGKHVNISSNLALTHPLGLIDVAGQTGTVRLTYRESA